MQIRTQRWARKCTIGVGFVLCLTVGIVLIAQFQGGRSRRSPGAETALSESLRSVADNLHARELQWAARQVEAVERLVRQVAFVWQRGTGKICPVYSRQLNPEELEWYLLGVQAAVLSSNAPIFVGGNVVGDANGPTGLCFYVAASDVVQFSNFLFRFRQPRVSGSSAVDGR